MTISTTTIKNSFSGDGSTTAFTYTFPINTTSEISVIERSATGTETIKAEGTGSTNYGIADNGAAGGTVTMVTAPADGTTLILRRNTDLTQETDYVANDPFPAETHEDALDKLQMQNQELKETLDRSFKVSQTNTITSSEFTDDAATRASKTLGFNSDGNLTTVADFLPAGGDSAQFTYSTTTTDADPGSGFIRFNNATIASATIAYIDDAEANGTDVSAWVQSFDDVTGNATNRGRIRVSKANTLDTWHVFKVNAAVTDASGYTKIPLTYIDGAGTIANNDKVFVSFVSSGEDGVSPGYFYKFATSTTDGDPGAGILRFDNATYASVTEIYIDDADQHGGATNADTLTWGSSTAGHKGFIQIVDVNDKATYVKFKVTGASTDASGYNKLTVVHVTSNNTFSADDELSVHFTASGNDGAIPGYEYTFDTTTTDADPGAGDVRFNNATYANVTEIYLDDDDANGVTTQADTATWGSSTSTIKGFLHISDTNDHSTYARFKITAAVTDASGYNKITVVHLASSNTFSAGDNLSVHFTRTGLKGDTGSQGIQGETGSTGATGDVSLAGTQTLTNKTLTSPKINEDVAVTSTATELNLLDGKAATNLALLGKQAGTSFTNSILVGHATTGTLNNADNNVGVGIGALDGLTGGDNNVALGYNAGTAIVGGYRNTTVGGEAGEAITNGFSNTTIGNQSGKLITGNSNITIGRSAGDNITSGDGNVIIGGINADSATGDKQLIVADGVDGSVAWLKGDSSGNVSVPANLNLSGSNKELRFYEGANYVGFEAPALTADKIWVLPAADGSEDQVIKTDGSGNLGFATAGGGSLVKLASTTLSSAAAGIAFNSTYITSTYDNYYVLINGIMPVTDNADIGVYLSVDNGSNFATITSGNHYLGIHDGGNGWQLNQNAHYVAHDCSNATGELKVNGYALIENVNDTTCWKSIYGRGMTQNSGTKTTDYAYATYSAFHSTTAVNYLIVKSNSGNLQGFGTVTLYGVEK